MKNEGGGRLAYKLVRISELIEHEEIDPLRLKELKKEILGDGFIRDPIIVDRNSNVILDGHHRLNILKSLHYSRIPVHYVDYLNDETIRLKTWYPLILGSERRLIELLDRESVIFNQTRNRRSSGELILHDRTLLLDSDRRNVMSVLTGRIKMDYASTKPLAKKLVRTKRVTATIVFSPISKNDVVRSAIRGYKFPPKTTRHIIPNKPRNWFIPLKDLK